MPGCRTAFVAVKKENALKLDQIVRNYGGPKGFWDRLKSISVAEIAREADRPLNVAIIGAPDVRAEAHTALYSDPGSIALQSGALPVAPALHGYDALTTEANFPNQPGIFDFVLDLGNGSREGLPAGTTVYSIRELGGWEATLDRIVEDRPDIELALARSFPIFRSRVAQRIINATAMTNAQFTMLTGIAAAFPLLAPLLAASSLSDIMILTKNQIMMSLRLAAIYGLEVDYRSRMKELAPILANAFGWRAIARELIGAVPVVGVVAKPAISYAGTVTVGKAAQVYYQTGENLSVAQLRHIYKEAYAVSREKLRALATNVRSKRRQGQQPEAELPQLTAAPMQIADIEYLEEATDFDYAEPINIVADPPLPEDHVLNS
ncbi:MAG: hypothetical protein JWN14_5077 [Chthonomonadales bacterium]|nr:hypothetical protein [Chthonomonadales bacterium]